MTENEKFGWHHRLSGLEFQQALGDGEGQGSPVCYSPWGYKESDMTGKQQIMFVFFLIFQEFDFVVLCMFLL